MSVKSHVANQRRKPKKIVKPVGLEEFRKNAAEGEEGQILDTQHLLISALLPPAVRAFLEEVDAEVSALCGPRYARTGGACSRYGSQRGSIVLGHQQVAVKRPRVRDTESGRETKLETYERFQDPALFDEKVFNEGLKKVSQRDYRGLPEREILFIVDGGSGLNKALKMKYEIDDPKARRAVRIRCYVHKWNNLRDVLDENGQAEVRPLYCAIRDARDLVAARACSDALEAALRRLNASALASYLEAKDDLLMLHRLKCGARLKKFFSTTNPIESLNSLLEEDMRRVKRWRHSEHFTRWLATACLHNEKRMRRVKGHVGLPALSVALAELCANQQESVDSETAVA